MAIDPYKLVQEQIRKQEHAEGRIMSAIEEDYTTLDLSNLGLKSLPEQIIWVGSLQFLHIKGNQLTQLPPGMSNLTNLVHLDASNNQLTDLPPEFARLTKLKKLILTNNLFPHPPKVIKHLSSLDFLFIDHKPMINFYKTFPGACSVVSCPCLSFTERVKNQLSIADDFDIFIQIRFQIGRTSLLPRIGPNIFNWAKKFRIYVDYFSQLDRDPEITIKSTNNMTSLSSTDYFYETLRLTKNAIHNEYGWHMEELFNKMQLSKDFHQEIKPFVNNTHIQLIDQLDSGGGNYGVQFKQGHGTCPEYYIYSNFYENCIINDDYGHTNLVFRGSSSTLYDQTGEGSNLYTTGGYKIGRYNYDV